jgi:diphosphomevalonate decarboxylase
MCALILVVSDARKDTGSTEGMQLSVETSSLLQERIRSIVPQRMREMEMAILDKDFDTFAELTMRDSNQFHSICLDTFPPIFYMNDISKSIISFVTAYNKASDQLSYNRKVEYSLILRSCYLIDIFFLQNRKYHAAYTYDAGPNAVLYLEKSEVPEVLTLLHKFFPPPSNADMEEYYGRELEVLSNTDPERMKKLEERIEFPVYEAGCLRRIISTTIGDGPRLLMKGWYSESLFQENGDLKIK